MENKSTEHSEFTLLQKIPKNEMTALLEKYLEYAAKYKYLRYIIFGVVAVIAGYNFFVVGKRFPLDELNTIKTVMASIMGVFVIALLVLAVMLYKTLRTVKKALNESANRYGIDKKLLKKEFHLFVKASLGGPGLR